MAWYLEEKDLGYTPWLGNEPEEEPEEEEDTQEELEDAFVEVFCPDEEEAE